MRRSDAPLEHHSALLALFEITDVAARADLKTDLLQELERQKQMLGPLRQNPQIEQRTLEELLAQIDAVSAQLLAQAGKVGRAPARQRVADGDQAAHRHPRRHLRIRPAGVSLVAAPAPGRAAQRPARWIEPFAPIRAGAAIIMKLLRDNGRASRHTAQPRRVPAHADDDEGRAAPAPHGARATLPCVPEISANKYALNIRFIGVSGMDRGAVCDEDVEFELMFCNL